MVYREGAFVDSNLLYVIDLFVIRYKGNRIHGAKYECKELVCIELLRDSGGRGTEQCLPSLTFPQIVIRTRMLRYGISKSLMR
jgi:hypothetical protein